MSARWWPLAALALVAGLLRFWIAESTYPVRLRGDEVYYVRVAGEIAAGHGHVHPVTQDRAKRPPLQAFVLSRFLDADWNTTEEKALESIHHLVRVEVVLGTLLVVAIYLLGRAWFGPKIGLLAGIVAALEPTLVAYSHYLWSETLCALLLAAALLGVVLAARGGSRIAAIAAGLSFGLATLTREVALPVAAVCACWLAWKARPGEKRLAVANGAILLAATVAVVLPWTIRNYRLFHRFVPVSTIGWMAIAEGNTLDAEHWFREPPKVAALRAEVAQGKDEIERDAIARRWALDRIGAEQPSWVFEKLLRNTALLLSPDSNLLLKLREGAYGSVAPARIRCLEAASLLIFIATLGLACLGLAGASPDARALALSIFAIVLALHVVSNAVSRFRVPWMPLLIVLASVAAVDVAGSFRRASPRAKVITAAVILYFLAVCVPYHRAELAALWECRTPAQPEADGG
jgi:4-amino-4-deoxy-L-arabinose transferase-like glycosyltransferase